MPSDKGETQLSSCSIETCERKRQARGLCSSHYSTWHRKLHGRKKSTKTCNFCENEYRAADGRSAYCSLGCAARHREGWSRSKALVTTPRGPRHTEPEVTIIPSGRARWFACICRVCRTPFIAVAPYAHCTDACRRITRRTYSHARKTREGKFSVPDHVRLSVYERDGWDCQICGTETSRTYSWSDPLSPTLDHIIPQSTQLLPDHSPRNLRLAHALCNSLRGDGTRLPDHELRERARQKIQAA